jgi:Fe-S-cluster-containing hydrogenase component 2
MYPPARRYKSVKSAVYTIEASSLGVLSDPIHCRESASCRQVCETGAVGDEHRVWRDKKSADLLAHSCAEGVLECLRAWCFQRLHFHSERPGRSSYLSTRVRPGTASLSSFAQSLVTSLALVVAATITSTRWAAKKSTATIPIVFLIIADPGGDLKSGHRWTGQNRP